MVPCSTAKPKLVAIVDPLAYSAELNALAAARFKAELAEDHVRYDKQKANSIADWRKERRGNIRV